MKRTPRWFDMMGIILSCLLYHEEHFALTGGALRRLAYAATGRPTRPGGYSGSFTRLVASGYVVADKGKTRGARTWRISDKGREALSKRETLLRANDVDPDAWLADAHKYLRTKDDEVTA